MALSPLIPHPRPGVVRILLCAAATVVLASCSSNAPAPARTATSSPPAPAPSAAPTTPSPTPTPSLPAAADGKHTRSCADGTCEIRVNGPVTVPLPARFDVGPIEVTHVKTHSVQMVVPLNQSDFSSDGGCGATFTAGRTLTSVLSCHAGETVVIDGMKLKVLGIAHKDAVIRIRPAK